MKLLIVAVGQRVPDWAQTACNDYAKRLPPELKLELKAVKTEPRAGKTLASLLAAERGRIEAAIPRGAQVVALDERGTRLTTLALAERLRGWQLVGDTVALLVRAPPPPHPPPPPPGSAPRGGGGGGGAGTGGPCRGAAPGGWPRPGPRPRTSASACRT